MRDPKAIRKAIMAAKSVARLIDPHFGRVPMPNLGKFGGDEPIEEHSPMIHEVYGEPMPEHFAGGGEVYGDNSKIRVVGRHEGEHRLVPISPKNTNYRHVMEYVPIEWLLERRGNEYRHSPERMAQLRREIEEEGLREPVLISVGKNSRTAITGEGNHRVLAAHQLGYTHIPVRAMVGDAAGNDVFPEGAHDEDIIPKPNKYFPSEAKPSRVMRSLGYEGQEELPEHWWEKGYAEGGDVEPNEYAQPNEYGIYSHAAAVASQLPQMKGTPDQYRNMLIKRGVKPSELQWSGYDQEFADRPQVSRQDVAEHFYTRHPYIEPHILDDDQGGETLYGDYTLPGGRNYRENILKLHSMDGDYRSSHWPGVKNPVAHLRLSDRKDQNGSDVLHMEELQSDWAQEGRRKGFKPSEQDHDDLMKRAWDARQAMLDYYENLPERHKPTGFEVHEDIDRMTRGRYPIFINPQGDASDKIDNFISAYSDLEQAQNALSRAPYVTKTNDWVDLGLKHALYEAADKGYDKFVWTPGEAQADRYDLSKHISQIRHEKNDDGTYNLDVADKNGRRVFDRDDVNENELADIVGKDMAEKIVSGHGDPDENPGYRDWRTISGLDLKVGGEGMRDFYDKIVPSRLRELIKRHDPDAKIQTVYTEHGVDDEDPYLPEHMRQKKSLPLPGVIITPKMRESILSKGFPAYASGGDVEEHKGSELMARDPSIAENPPEMESEFATSPAKPIGEMSAKYIRHGHMEPWREKHPEKLYREGAVIFPALGDLTMADRLLTHIGEHELSKPVELTGGGEYQRIPYRGAWASRALTAAMNAQKMARQNPEGRPAYMAHTTMGLPSGDSSHMMAQGIIRLIQRMPISQKAADEFDENMRKTDPEWPGILNADASERHLLRKEAKGGKDYVGTRVSNFLKTFDKARWRALGFPGIGEVRFATSEKRLLGVPQLSSGFSLAKVDTSGKIQHDPERGHETYSGIIPKKKDEGETGYAGGFRHIVPASAMFIDWLKRQPRTFHRKVTGEDIPITKTMLQQSLMTQHPSQIANQEWLDAVMPEYEKGRKWGFNSGGSVKRALMIAKSTKRK